MRATSVDLIGGFYRADSLSWASQDTVNWLPVAAEVAGTLTVKRLATPPGLRPYQQIGTGPIRGMHDCEGLRLVVSGKWLYRISNDGVGVPIGQIPGVGRVQITHNQFKTGYQVLVENGQGGGGYVYDTTTQAFGRITDAGYPGSISSDYLDSFMLGVEPQGRFWFHSNLADATDYNTLDRYEAEASPDRIVGLAVSQFEVVVFGQRTIEFFYNAGLETGTFKNRRQAITRGCASRHTIQKLDNTLFWLGDDGIVYRLNGYSPQPVSTNAIADAIAGYNWSEAFAFVWEDKGFKVYYLTFPDGQTFGYDVVSRLWHRRESFELLRWRPTHSVKWGRDWFVGDFQSGRTFRLDWDYHLEGSEPIISERVSPALYDDQSRIGIPNAELVFDTGQGPGTVGIEFTPQPTPPALSGSAPDAALNAAYTPFQYSVAGGTPPLVFTVVGGSLPAGMALTTAGLLGGTPSATGQSSFAIRVTDANGLWDERADSIIVAAVTMVVGTASGAGGTGARTQTTVNGDTWENLTPSSIAANFSLVVGLANGRFGLGATNQSWRYSDTAGASWVTVSGTQAVDADMVGGKLVVARGAASSVGRWGVSTDNGATFVTRDTALGFDLLYVAISRASPSLVLAGGQFRMGISTDGATSFPSSQAYPAGFIGGCIAADGGTFYIGGQAASRPAIWTTTNGTSFSSAVTLDSSVSNVQVRKILIVNTGSGTTILCFTRAPSAIYMTRDNFASVVKLPFVMDGTFEGATHNGVEFIVVTSTTIYTAVDPAQGFTVSTSAITSPMAVGSAPHG